MNPISTYQHTPTLVRIGAVGTPEARGNTAMILIKALQSMTGTQASCRQPCLRSSPKNTMELAAMDGQLRHVMSAPKTALACPYALAEVVHISQFARPNGQLLKFSEDTERHEHACAVRKYIDPNSDLVDFGGGLKDHAGNAKLMQR